VSTGQAGQTMWKYVFVAGVLGAAGAWAQDAATSAQLTERGISQYRARDFSGAIVTFQSALDRDPKNATTLRGIAEASFQEGGTSRDPIYKNKMFDEAARWDHRLLEVNPQESAAYYSLGVIAWSRVYPELRTARTQSGMQPQDPAPIKDPTVRQKMQALYEPAIDGGIQDLKKALEIDKNNSDAMAYMNLLLRSRADVRDTIDQASEDVRAADNWVNKSLEAKRAAGPMTASIWNVAPPPPPPPPPGANTTKPGAIRVGGNVQATNLVAKVDPVYPPLALQARIQGTVRFNTVIGKDGHIENLTLISGHPLLVGASQQAVQQWVYKPTLLNGQPVEVISTIDVNFSLPQ
jgi:TonB family protein